MPSRWSLPHHILFDDSPSTRDPVGASQKLRERREANSQAGCGRSKAGPASGPSDASSENQLLLRFQTGTTEEGPGLPLADPWMAKSHLVLDKRVGAIADSSLAAYQVRRLELRAASSAAKAIVQQPASPALASWTR